MKTAKFAMLTLTTLAAGFLSGCATSPVAECVDTEIAPVAEYATPVQIVREAPIGETIIQRSSTISPQTCF